MNRRVFVQSATVLAATRPLVLQAQSDADWPQRPLRWIVSQPAGAGPDIIARFLAERLSKVWGQPVLIENKPGGQNVIGAQAAAKSAPDGYNFYYATTAAIVTNSFTFRKLPYDPVNDFVPVRLVGKSPFVIAAGNEVGVKTLADVIAKARSEPATVSIATEGPKTFSGMLADSFAAKAGVKLNHVAYTKATDAIQDLIGGRVQLICLPEAALMTFIQSGQLQALAVSTAQRLSSLAATPTMAETFTGYEYTGWNGLFAPAGTSAQIVARVNRDLQALLEQPEVAQRLLALGSIAEPRMSVAQFDAFLRTERDRWAGIVKDIGIVPE